MRKIASNLIMKAWIRIALSILLHMMYLISQLTHTLHPHEGSHWVQRKDDGKEKEKDREREEKERDRENSRNNSARASDTASIFSSLPQPNKKVIIALLFRIT